MKIGFDNDLYIKKQKEYITDCAIGTAKNTVIPTIHGAIKSHAQRAFCFSSPPPLLLFIIIPPP